MNASAPPLSELRIAGVVTPLGPFGFSTREHGWMLGFHVNPWRLLDGPLNFTELRVTKPMPREQIDAAKAGLAATSVVSLLIRDLEPTERGTHIARLEEVAVFNTSDHEMEAAAAELRLPVALHTETLGMLRLDRRINIFEGEVTYLGRSVQLSIPAAQNSSEIDAGALSVAIQLVANLPHVDRAATQFAASRLTQPKNDSWLEEDENDVSEREFQQRLVLTAIEAEAEGGISLFYDDGNLFFGHPIDVRGVVTGEFHEASISG